MFWELMLQNFCHMLICQVSVECSHCRLTREPVAYDHNPAWHAAAWQVLVLQVVQQQLC